MDKLKELRHQLDGLDAEIVTLLDQRMKIVDEMSVVKDAQHVPLTDLEREHEILFHLQAMAKHPVLKDQLPKIYQPIMDCSKAAQLFKKHTVLPFSKIGIIGLGLMGGSIAKGLKAKNPDLKLMTLQWDSEDFRLAVDNGLISIVFPTLLKLLQNCELLVIASPLSTIFSMTNEINSLSAQLEHPLIVMDLASVKSDVVYQFENLTQNRIEYLSTHPMTGSEKKGLDNSHATLFINFPWIISPHGKNKTETLNRVQQMIQYLGGKPILMNAEEHDKKACLISHLPALLSYSLFNFVRTMDPESLEIAGPGFKSVTRLAHHNPTLRAEMALYNQSNLQSLLKAWLQQINPEKL